MGTTSRVPLVDHAYAARPDPYRQSLWYACYTRGRHEQLAAFLLSQRGVETFLPLVARQSRWKDRFKMRRRPLFPSYVFGRFSLHDYHTVLSTPGVTTVVRWNGFPAPISEEELENVRRFAEGLAKTGMEVEPLPLVREGQWVRVDVGPFRGVRGIVVKLRGRRRVLIGIAAVNLGFAVNIDLSCLAAIESPDFTCAALDSGPTGTTSDQPPAS